MAIVRLDKVQAAYNGNIVTIESSSAMSNGTLWVLGGLKANEREVFTVSAATNTNVNGLDPIVLHASAEYDYDPTKVGLKDFQLAANTPGRAYHLVPGDIITVTDDLFDNVGVPAVGDYVGPSLKVAGLFQKLSANNASGTVTNGTNTAVPNLVFKVIENTTLGYDQSSAKALMVIKNNA